jgi:hypothetical protein
MMYFGLREKATRVEMINAYRVLGRKPEGNRLF